MRIVTTILALALTGIPTFLHAYQDANVWKYAYNMLYYNLYTVPVGQDFWLYGMCFTPGTSDIKLRANDSTFWRVSYEVTTWSHEFSVPIKFGSGTVFATDCDQGSILIYGYQGISNSVSEDNIQRSAVLLDSGIEAYPIPFSDHTSIKYKVPKQDMVVISIYDEAGRLVRTLVNETMPTGSYTARWDGRDSKSRNVPSGSYFCIVKTNGESSTKIVYID